MGDGFHLFPEDVTRLGKTFADQRQPLSQAGESMLRATGAVSTGDQGLDAETRSLIDEVNSLYRYLGELAGGVADALAEVVATYEEGDSDVAASYLSLIPDSSQPASTDTPTS